MFRTKRTISLAFLGTFCVLAVTPNSWGQQNGDPKALQFVADHGAELRQTTQVARKLYLLTNLAPAALAANDPMRARDYAEELLALGQSEQSQPGFGPSIYGNSKHVANLVLGQLALMNGDVSQAKERLLTAGQVPGSPTLKSFGPDMLLAKELIEKGERETAISYFDLCAKFWENDRGRLQQWRTNVSQGGIPDFGANLSYIFDGWRFAK